MPAGIPGRVTRAWDSNVEPQIITPTGTTGAPTAYGVPLVVDQTAGNVGNMRTVQSTDLATALYGVLVQPFPTQQGSATGAFGVGTPPASGPCDVLKSGYLTVLLAGTAAAVKGQPVYVWVAASTGSHVQGGFEGAATSGSTVVYPNAYFMGPADSIGNVEIAINP